MKLCTTTIITGLDLLDHFAIVQVRQPNWPIAQFGFASGANAKKTEAEAKFFADAPVMMDMLEHLAKEFGNVSPQAPLSDDRCIDLQMLAERASRLVAKHAGV